ncbi:hypothetical protein CMT41_12205 [Colwellia sp. MT41]|uniref:Uncharacterized protein n=1 Tax=Colwellia marinimaniae TaxID=1513592 RepID=A0ABQ0MSF0_9GAMM|nr:MULTISPECIES: hypothetical protein [Colwellia]ALO35396.1 hypothetical protein CMT41_12205 [Colwellia sp. MT41]GAW95296.1 hypothetical protein MTCD1_00898 [Colwellia marinimaniae]
MSALAKTNISGQNTEEKRLAKDINLIYDFTEKPNRTQLKAKSDRAVVAKLRADLVLPNNKILTVDIDFDSTSGYHNNTMLVMDDFGVDMLVTAFAVKYGQSFADKITKAWAEKKQHDDPRKPTYLLVQKPIRDGDLPKVFAACGDKIHDNDNKTPQSIV